MLIFRKKTTVEDITKSILVFITCSCRLAAPHLRGVRYFLILNVLILKFI